MQDIVMFGAAGRGAWPFAFVAQKRPFDGIALFRKYHSNTILMAFFACLSSAGYRYYKIKIVHSLLLTWQHFFHTALTLCVMESQ